MKIFKIFFQIIFICCLLISNFYIPKVEAKTIGELNGWKPMDIFGLYGFSTTMMQQCHKK